MYLSKLLSFCLVALCFGCAVAADEQLRGTGTVTLQVFGASSKWWLAVLPLNDGGATTTVELQDGTPSASFVAMEPNAGWGYFTSTSASGVGFTCPVTIRLTSSNGDQIVTQLQSIEPDATIDTGAQYTAATAPSPSTPEAPQSTSSPSTPETPQSTSAPLTSKATSDLCDITSTSEEPLKLLVPLYVYPGAAWDSLVDAADQVQIIAIINPNSGPLSTVDSSYTTYLSKLSNAGIEMIGYVHTSYGQRSISDVEADINTWAANYPLITGIFFDEASSDASELPYYTQAYQQAMSKPGYNQVILNPGAEPDQGYYSVSTSIVIFENEASNLAGTNFGSWVTCAPSEAEQSGYKYHFSGIAHTAASGTESTYLSALAAKGMGLVYVTDGLGGCCTYNSLVSYFAQEASALQALN